MIDPLFLALTAFFGFISLLNWRFGFLALLLFTPFNTGVAIAFSKPIYVLMKEFFFALPLYLSILGIFLKLKPYSKPGKTIANYALIFIFIVLVNFVLNNINGSLISGVIGMKVWIFYLPLIPITCLYLRDAQDLAFLQRCFTIVGIIACAVGLYQFIDAFFLGQQPAVFGTLPGQLFGGFREFNPSGGRFRFPGTFSNSNLFGAFCLFQALFILPAALHESQKTWKRIYIIGFLSACLGAFVSGQLTIWVMFILLVVLFAAWTRRLGSAILPIVGVGGFISLAQQIASQGLEGQVTALQYRLSEQSFFSIDLIWFALYQAPLLGQGLGTATVQARYGRATDVGVIATPGGVLDGSFLFETYPAKVVFELGGIGAIATYLFYIVCWFTCWTLQQRLKQPFFRDFAKALLLILAVIYIYPMANWLDPEPLNVYYWVIVGILLTLPRLDDQVTYANWHFNSPLTS